MRMAQKEILDQKAALSAAQKQEKEAHKQFIALEQEEAAAAASERALRVRREIVASERRRARSEGAKLELGRANFQEKLAREEDARRANQQQISRMEKEEAELIARLQRSQERHRVAFAQLEDALAGGSPSQSSSRCDTHLPVTELPQGSTPTSSCRALPALPSSSAVEPRAVGSRPPRPRVASTPTPPPGAVAGTAGPRSRPTSASRASSVPRMPASVASKPGARSSRSVSLTSKGNTNSATSICSTASGGPGAESAASGQASGHSTPSSAVPAPITYTTMDGMQLEIPPEEDLDLAKLLNS